METANIYITFFIAEKSDNRKNVISEEIEKILKNELIKILFLQDINIDRSNDENNNPKYKITFTYDNWHTVFYEISKFSESLGSQWQRTGDIDFELNLWTDKPTLDNVDAIDINVYDSRNEWVGSE